MRRRRSAKLRRILTMEEVFEVSVVDEEDEEGDGDGGDGVAVEDKDHGRIVCMAENVSPGGISEKKMIKSNLKSGDDLQDVEGGGGEGGSFVVEEEEEAEEPTVCHHCGCVSRKRKRQDADFGTKKVSNSRVATVEKCPGEGVEVASSLEDEDEEEGELVISIDCEKVMKECESQTSDNEGENEIGVASKASVKESEHHQTAPIPDLIDSNSQTQKIPQVQVVPQTEPVPKTQVPQPHIPQPVPLTASFTPNSTIPVSSTQETTSPASSTPSQATTTPSAPSSQATAASSAPSTESSHLERLAATASTLTSSPPRPILPKWRPRGEEDAEVSKMPPSVIVRAGSKRGYDGTIGPDCEGIKRVTLKTSAGPVDVRILKHKAERMPNGQYKCPVVGCHHKVGSRVYIAKHFDKDHPDFRSWRDVFIDKNAPPFTVPSKEDFSDFDKLHREANSNNVIFDKLHREANSQNVVEQNREAHTNHVGETVIAEINVDVAQNDGVNIAVPDQPGNNDAEQDAVVDVEEDVDETTVVTSSCIQAADEDAAAMAEDEDEEVVDDPPCLSPQPPASSEKDEDQSVFINSATEMSWSLANRSPVCATASPTMTFGQVQPVKPIMVPVSSTPTMVTIPLKQPAPMVMPQMQTVMQQQPKVPSPEPMVLVPLSQLQQMSQQHTQPRSNPAPQKYKIIKAVVPREIANQVQALAANQSMGLSTMTPGNVTMTPGLSPPSAQMSQPNLVQAQSFAQPEAQQLLMPQQHQHQMFVPQYQQVLQPQQSPILASPPGASVMQVSPQQQQQPVRQSVQVYVKQVPMMQQQQQHQVFMSPQSSATMLVPVYPV